MRVRAVDSSNDWTFGQGKQNYKVDIDAVSQNIKTRLQSFVNDCFFATADGLDWFNLMGSKNQKAFKLAISTTLLNTEGVTGILELSYTLNETRAVTIQYKVQTVYSSNIQDIYQYSVGV